MQYGSGVVGGVIVLAAARGWWRRTAPQDPVATPQRIPPLGRVAARSVSVVVLGAGLAAGTLGFLAGFLTSQSLASILYLMVTWGLSTGILTALVCAAALRARGALG